MHGLAGDVALAADVRRVAREVDARLLAAPGGGSGGGGGGGGRGLDGVVCNAGALLHERRETAEDLEVTLAAHLVHGAYLLANELRPALERAEEPRVVLVSSGGMYTAKWPGMAAALRWAFPPLLLTSPKPAKRIAPSAPLP